MSADEWRRLGEAIVIWSGWGISPSPSRDEARLASHYGQRLAAQLLPLIRELEDDFYSSDARHTATNIADMARISSAQFLKTHPEVPVAAVRALAWCYTFDYK